MKTIIISEGAVFYNKRLLSFVCGRDKEFIKKCKQYEEIIDLWNMDPDFIRLPNVEKRIAFVRYEFKTVQYVIVPDYALDKGYSEETDKIDSDLLKTMLLQFFAKDWKDHFINQSINGNGTWQHFDTNSNGIAFRDGSGYAYAIHDYIS